MKNFAGINFRESTFSGDKKGIFSQIWSNFAKFTKFPSRENFFPQGSQKSASKWSKSHGNDIFEIVIFHCFTYSFIESLEIMIASRQEGGPASGVKKISLPYIKVQPVMELQLFTESQNLRLWGKYGASKFGGITRSHTKYMG